MQLDTHVIARRLRDKLARDENVSRQFFMLKTRYCPLSIASCDPLAAIFVMLKILRLLFVGRIELFNNNGRLALVKTKTTTRGTQSIMANTGPLSWRRDLCI